MVGTVGDPGYFRLRSNLGVGWELGDFAVNYLARYYSGMKEKCTGHGCDEPDRYVFDNAAPVRTVGSNTFHDVQVSWKAPWNGTVAVGANNVFGHEGPVLYSDSDARKSSFPGYGGFDIGGFYYLKYQQRF
jgi:iron complex outermembrane receptor protein